MRELMKCGHTANSYIVEKGSRAPACVICGCTEIESDRPSLEGRKAKCTGHKYPNPKIIDSDWRLPFFKHCPDEQYDEYYCGCWGWD